MNRFKGWIESNGRILFNGWMDSNGWIDANA